MIAQSKGEPEERIQIERVQIGVSSMAGITDNGMWSLETVDELTRGTAYS